MRKINIIYCWNCTAKYMIAIIFCNPCNFFFTFNRCWCWSICMSNHNLDLFLFCFSHSNFSLSKNSVAKWVKIKKNMCLSSLLIVKCIRELKLHSTLEKFSSELETTRCFPNNWVMTYLWSGISIKRTVFMLFNAPFFIHTFTAVIILNGRL